MNMTAQKYQPDNFAHRMALAQQMKEWLEALGFVQQRRRTPAEEEIWAKEISEETRMRVMVYTTIGANGACRSKATDSIKISLLYRKKDGHMRGIGRAYHVNRTGTIHNILERIEERVVELWDKADNPERCGSCSTPLFLSKSENWVCAEACWVG